MASFDAQTLADLSTDWILSCSRDGTVSYINPAACSKLLTQNRQHLNLWNLFPKEDKELIQKHIKELGRVEYESVKVHIRRNKNPVPASLWMHPLPEEDAEQFQVIIRPKENIEQPEPEPEQKLLGESQPPQPASASSSPGEQEPVEFSTPELFRKVGAIYTEVRLDGTILYVDPKIQNYIELSPTDLLGKKISELPVSGWELSAAGIKPLIRKNRYEAGEFKLNLGNDHHLNLKVVGKFRGKTFSAWALPVETKAPEPDQAMNRKRINLLSMVADLTSRFINIPPGKMDEVIRLTLEAIGATLHFDRCYLCDWRAGQNGQLQVWLIHADEEQKQNNPARMDREIKNLPPERITWIRSRLAKEKYVYIPNTKEAVKNGEEPVTAILESGIGSLMIFPIAGESGVIGYLGMDGVHPRHDQWEGNIHLISLIADIYSQVLERRLMEKELKGARSWFKLLEEGIQDIISIHSRTGTVLWTSPSLVNHLGYTKNEVLGKNGFEFIHPDDRVKMIEQIREPVLNKKQSVTETLQVRARHKDGNYRWFDVLVQPIFDEEGYVKNLLFSARNISKEVEVEQKLETSKGRFNTLLQVIPVPVCLLDSHTNQVLEVNEPFHKLSGYHPDELSGKNFDKLNVLDYPLDEIIENNGVHQHIDDPGSEEYVFTTRSGDRRYVLIYEHTLPNTEEHQRLLLFVDYSNQKMIQENLYVMENALESSITGIVMTSMNGRITYANFTFLNMWNYESVEEIIGRRIERFFSEPSKSREMLIELQKHGEWRGKEEARRSDRSTFMAEINANTIYDKAGNAQGYMGSFIDITTQEEAQKNLQLERQRLQQAQQTAQIGSWELDLKTGKIYWSDELFRIYGLEPQSQDVTIALMYSFIPEEEHEKIDKNLELLQKGEPINVDHTIIRPDGSRRYVNQQGRLLDVQDTGKILLSGTTHDITERKTAENALVEQKQFFQIILDSVSSPIAVIDAAGEFMAQNRAWENSFMASGHHENLKKKEESEPTFRYILKNSLPERADELCEGIKKVMQRSLSYYENTFMVAEQKGKWYSMIVSPLAIPLKGVVISLVDVTRPKFNENLVRHQRDILTMIVQDEPLNLVLGNLYKMIQSELSKYETVILALDDQQNFIPVPPQNADENWLDDFPQLNLNNKKRCGLSGAAARRRRRVVIDSFEDEQARSEIKGILSWANKNNLKAGWAQPILTSDSEVLGTITIFYKERRRPDSNEIQIVTNAAKLAALAITTTGNKKALDQTNRNLFQAQRMAHIGSWEWYRKSNRVHLSNEMRNILGIHHRKKNLSLTDITDLVHPDDKERVQSKLVRAVKMRSSLSTEHRIKREDGSIRQVHTQAELILNEEGNYLGLRGVMQDITETKRREAQIKRSLEEKEVLLREVHHRVKNNLHIIKGLLELKSIKHPDLTVLKDTMAQIQAMAIVHENTYRTIQPDAVEPKKYIKRLVDFVFQAYGVNGDFITYELDIDTDHVQLTTSMYAGLIINELLTNALKFAFPEGKGKIWISLKQTDGNVELVVQDNGVGLPDHVLAGERSSVGMNLVHALSERQLKGNLEISNDPMTTFRITF